jgi:environmental stress-induced protein Ves
MKLLNLPATFAGRETILSELSEQSGAHLLQSGFVIFPGMRRILSTLESDLHDHLARTLRSFAAPPVTARLVAATLDVCQARAFSRAGRQDWAE